MYIYLLGLAFSNLCVLIMAIPGNRMRAALALSAIGTEIGRQLELWDVGAADIYQWRDFLADLQ